jgi:hypothetical protein
MSPIAMLFTLLAAAAAVVLAVLLFIYVVVPLLKLAGKFVRHVFRFIGGEVSDLARLVGAIVLAVVYVPIILVNIIIGRWSAAGHYGRSLTHEGQTMGLCLYRIVVGHPLRLLGLGGVVEGVEQRLPAAMAEAPTADAPSGKASRFEGYRIVGSLPAGGSGAKLYIADVDEPKRRLLAKQGAENVGQVVLKVFSLADGSSLPQIVRESRSLDAAKKLGLILDHELTADRFFYAMRYVPGESLGAMTKVLHASSPAGGLGDAQLRSALSYVSDLVGTLAAYHRGGLWHKDVKPDNVIIDREGRAHLVDFGLVSSLRSAMTLTTHGTEYFRDPEMVRLALKGVKVHEVDGTKFDIYGAGAVLYAVVEDSFPAHGVLSQVTRRCPESVRWIIRRAMSDYAQRYPSADAMLADLEAVRTAIDPFAVRPADLPSMRGNFGSVPGMDASSAGTPVPPAPMPVVDGAPGTPGAGAAAGVGAGAAAAGAGAGVGQGGRARTAPVIRVTDWWTGRSEVVGAAAVGAGAAVAGSSVMHGAWPGAPVGAPVGAPARSAATPVPPMPRRSAAAQRDAARDRREARRERAAARVIPAKAAGTWNSGVAAAVLIFLGSLVGLGVVLSTPSRQEQAPAPAPVARTAPMEPTLRGGLVRVVDLGAVAPFPGAEAGVALAGEQVRGRRVLVVSDLREPMHEDVRRRVTRTVELLRDAGADVRGNIPAALVTSSAESVESSEDVTLLASARARLGLLPIDGPEADAALREWLASREGEVDAVVWFAPAPGPEPLATTRVGVFTRDEPKAATPPAPASRTAKRGRTTRPANSESR